MGPKTPIPIIKAPILSTLVLQYFYGDYPYIMGFRAQGFRVF